MPAPALLADRLCKSFGALKAVGDVSFQVAAGEIVGLVGPNGAGKTTTISALASVSRVCTGVSPGDPSTRWSEWAARS